VGFLTRVPVGVTTGSPAAAVGWFPAVGAGIGLTQGLLLAGAGDVTTPLLAAALAVAASTLVTGAFHLDGIADVADAFGGGWTQQQRLEILKDSRLGTYGTATVSLVLLIETAALSAIIDSSPPPWWWPVTATVAAHTWSRAVAVATMRIAPLAGDGLGAGYAAGLSWPPVVAATLTGVIALIPPVVATDPGADVTRAEVVAVVLATALASSGAAAAVVRLAVTKIGGVTGDVLGAVQQVAALTTLCGLATLG
jgi:adenosylcobinamide-GDP ribazoletransferase